MKLRNVVLSSVAGMVLTSTLVYTVTPALRTATAAPPPSVGIGAELAPAEPSAPARPPASFDTGSTLRVEGRLGHARLARGARGQTYLMLEVRGAEGLRATSAPASHLAVVVDRSGSMKGDRIQNARMAAKAAVDRLADGDVISVVAFDTRPNVVMPATRIDDGTRALVKAAVDRINLGGDTCISCGIDEGMRELSKTTDKVHRMIVLSDGDATDGVRDVQGFRSLAQRARGAGITVSTIGVGLGYNQAILGAVAQEASGGHYFIENAASLDRAFEAESLAMRSTLATEAEAVISLGEQVTAVKVFDRAFERRGNNEIVVPLGAFAQGEVKTVLVEIDVPASVEGPRQVVSVDVGYRDLVGGGPGHASGTLGLSIGREDAELDPIVGGRIARSGTAEALLRANELAARGDLDEAQRVLDAQRRKVTAAAAAPNAMPNEKAARDFGGQAGSLDDARRGLKKSPKKADVDRGVRRNQEMVIPLFR